MATMTSAQKNIAIKESVIGMITIPTDAIQIGDYSYAIPTQVEGEIRYGVITCTAKNNRDTKTTGAFNPELVRIDWLAEKELKAKVAAEKAEEKKRKITRKNKDSAE